MKTTSIHAKSGLSSLSFIFVFVFFLQFTSFSQTISVDGNPSDWPAVLQNQPIATFEKDLPQSNDNQFTEGTKDFHNTNNMVWSLSPVGDKVNLVNAGAAIIDGWLYFFGDRTSSNGSAQIGFWVFQNGTAPTPEFGFTPPKTVGDLLILSEFTNGGGVATIKVFRWVGPGGSESSLVEVPLTEAQALAMVSANSTGFPVPNYPDWEYCNKEAKDCGTYYPGSFFEGMVDLEGLLTPEQLCNATFLLETRQSFSLSAMLGDFVAGSFNISPDAPVVQGATLCAPGGDVSLSVVSPDDDLTYNWYSDADLNNLVHTGDNYDVNVAITTSWYVTASLLSCESDPTQVTATILPNPGLSATAFHVSCYGENDGKVTGTVTNAATVKLFANDVQLASTAPGMGGSFEFSGLSAGDYKVVAESAPVNSVVCSSEEDVTVNEPAEVMLSISSLNVSCNGEADGSISIDSHSGTGSASFYISDDGGTTWTATTADDIEAGSYGPGTYTVKITYPDGKDDGVCEATDEVTISEPAEVMLSISSLNVSCNGEADGSISIDSHSGTGSASFYISDDGGTSWTATTADDIEAGSYGPGTYLVKVTYPDGNDDGVCEATDEVTISEPAEVMLSISSLNVSCNGEADGSISIDSHSGTGSASFYISDDGGTTWTATTADDIEAGSYGPGTYMVKVTYPDGNDDGVCEATDEVTISEPAEVMLSISSLNVSCNGEADGSISIDSHSGTGSASFYISDDGGTSWTATTADDIEAGSYGPGTYMVKVTYPDGNDDGVCEATDEVTISEPAEVMLSISSLNVSCNGEADGSISIDSHSGTGSASFYISDDGGTTWTATTADDIEAGSYGPGTYMVKVTYPDGNDDGVCEATDEVTISEPAEVMLSISSLNVSCNGEADGSISIDSHSGTGSASFYISDDGGTTWTATTADDIEAGLYGPGTYMVKVTYPDGNDDGVCEATDEVTISEPALVTVTAFATDATCEGLTDGTVYGSSTGAEKIELWLGGLLQAETIPAMDGSYTFNGLAAGIFMVKAVAAGYQEEVVCLASADVTVNEIPCVVVCETAYAMLEEGSVCFLEDKFNRWGWTNQIVEGEYTLPLYAGAAQCNTENGEHVGNVSITYGGGTMVVTYTIFEGFSMSEVHIYVGAGKYPLQRGKATVAPGQYTYNVGSLDKVVEYTATFTGVSGPVWVIAHAVTCDVSGTATGSGSMALNLGSSMLKSASIEGLDASELKVFPNPFSARTTFEFVSGKDVNARLEIYSITGQRITTLMDRQVEQGVLNRVEFEPSNLTPGMLLYRLTLGNEVQNGKLQYTK